VLHHDHLYYLPVSRRGSRESSVTKEVVKKRGRIVQTKPMKGLSRDWKDMFRRRKALDLNWKERKFHTTTISGHTDSGLVA
jgi:hypothetical protein